MQYIYKQSSQHYVKIGTGPKTILLLHGFLESSRMWQFFMNHFYPSYQTLAPDLLGHGSSEGIGYVYHMEDMAAAVNSLLEVEKIPKVSIIGHSMGGYVALAFAEMFPDKVAQVILLNSTPQADSSERKLNRDRAIELVKKNKDAFIRMSIANLLAEKNRERYFDELESLKEEALPMTAQQVVASLEGMKIRKNRVQFWKEISVPKMIIAGREDPIIPLDEIQKIADQTTTPLRVMDGGHLSYIEDRENLIKVLSKELI